MRSLGEFLLYLGDSFKVLVTKTIGGVGFGIFDTIRDAILLVYRWIHKLALSCLDYLSLWLLQLGFSFVFAVILVLISYPTVYIFFEFVGWPNERWGVADNYLYGIRVVFNAVVQFFHKDIVGEAPKLTPDLSLSMYKKLLSPKEYRLSLLLTVIICWGFTIGFYGNILLGVVVVTISTGHFGRDFEDAIVAVRLENKAQHQTERKVLEDFKKVYNKVFKVDYYKFSDEEQKKQGEAGMDENQEKSKKTENDNEKGK